MYLLRARLYEKKKEKASIQYFRQQSSEGVVFTIYILKGWPAAACDSRNISFLLCPRRTMHRSEHCGIFRCSCNHNCDLPTNTNIKNIRKNLWFEKKNNNIMDPMNSRNVYNSIVSITR